MFLKITEQVFNIVNKYIGKSNISEFMEQFLNETKTSLIQNDIPLDSVNRITENFKKDIGPILNKLKNQEVIKIFYKSFYDSVVRLLQDANRENIIIFKKNITRIMLFGLEGSGKTSASIKLAKKITGRNVCILSIYKEKTTDTQIKTLARANGIQYIGLQDFKTIDERIKKIKEIESSNAFDVLLFDTNYDIKDREDIKYLEKLTDIYTINYSFLIIDSMSNNKIIDIVQSTIPKLKINGAIVTKLDSSSNCGILFGIAEKLKLKIFYITNGEKINQIRHFDHIMVANQVTGFSENKDLFSMVRIFYEEDPTGHKKTRDQEINFDDLLVQLKSLIKFSEFSNIINMINLGKKENRLTKETKEKIKKQITIINAMTKKERSSPGLIKSNQDRANRIANGSSSSIESIKEISLYLDKLSKDIKQKTA